MKIGRNENMGRVVAHKIIHNHLNGPKYLIHYNYVSQVAGPRSAVGSASDSRARGPGFDTRSGHILSFLLPLIQEGQLSVTDKCICTKYWLTA